MSPIVAKMIFGPDGNSSIGILASNSTAVVTSEEINKAPDFHAIVSILKSMWAYIVIGSFILLISFLFFILYSSSTVTQEKARTSSGKPFVSQHHTVLVGLLFFFFFAYVGAEVAYGSFIFTFAKDYACMPSSQAAMLNSLFWAMFATCRGLAIFFAACIYPGTMILISLVGSTVSSLLLCLFTKNKMVLWACTGLYGASMATTFPSGISWVEQYTTVKASTAGVFVVGAALGEMVLPALVGFLSGTLQDQPVLMYLSLITATFTSILFPVMYKLASAPGEPSRKPRMRGRLDADDSEYRQALLDSGADEEEDNDVDQWNDADFEVIEMDDAAISPSKVSSASEITAASTSRGIEPVGGTTMSNPASLIGDSPRRKLLLTLDREKKD